MNTTDTYLAELLTGDEIFDARLRKAFELGIRHGQAADRDGLKRSAQIETTKKLLLTLVRVQRIDLNSAMTMLQIPKKDRAIYSKLFAVRERQKGKR